MLDSLAHDQSEPDDQDPDAAGECRRSNRATVGRLDSEKNLCVDNADYGVAEVPYCPHKFTSTPPPPDGLWDTEDVHFLDKVLCNACVRLTRIDPKNGSFEGRLKFYWKVRTPHSKYDRTEPRVRVPGIRATRLVCQVHESRIWREAVEDSSVTMCWKGTTDITFTGYEIFEVHDFPFDRQLINLDMFEFVWRSERDSSNFDETMKLVSLTMTTLSTLPEWDTFPALIIAQEGTALQVGPTYASRFVLRLRIQRKPTYYITQIFLVAFLILLAAVLPLGLEPGSEHIGDRLSLHAAGLLTLVAFKYGVSNDLPIVPYGTFTTKYLNSQITTVVSVSVESLISYRLVMGGADIDSIDIFEDMLLIALIGGWFAYLCYCAFGKEARPWEDVIGSQMSSEEISDDPDNGEFDQWGGLAHALDKMKGTSPKDDETNDSKEVGSSVVSPVGSPVGTLAYRGNLKSDERYSPRIQHKL